MGRMRAGDEVPDSEDELVTSSPQPPKSDPPDKLSAAEHSHHQASVAHPQETAETAPDGGKGMLISPQTQNESLVSTSEELPNAKSGNGNHATNLSGVRSGLHGLHTSAELNLEAEQRTETTVPVDSNQAQISFDQKRDSIVENEEQDKIGHKVPASAGVSAPHALAYANTTQHLGKDVPLATPQPNEEIEPMGIAGSSGISGAASSAENPKNTLSGIAYQDPNPSTEQTGVPQSKQAEHTDASEESSEHHAKAKAHGKRPAEPQSSPDNSPKRKEPNSRATNTETPFRPNPTLTPAKVNSTPQPPIRPSQEQVLADLQAEKAALLAKLAALPNIASSSKLNPQNNQQAQSTGSSSSGDASSAVLATQTNEDTVMKTAQELVRKHIKLLHEYNEIKDVAQGLFGILADQRGVRVVEVQEEFGMSPND